jgi:outer membrane protein assembly factor BamB
MRNSLLLTISLLTVLILVAGCPNKAPRIPAKPSGPTLVKINDTAAYTSVTTDPNRDKVLYVFNWGDGDSTTTALIKSGDTITESHAWAALGVYPVKVKAKDEKGKWSADWSDTLNVTVDTTTNHRPDAPLKPTHTGLDSVGKPIVFTTSATDPDGDSVQIKFYFGDGGTPTYGPKVASGATFTDTVVYNTDGWKVVYAEATDGRAISAQSAPDSIFINSPPLPPGAPILVPNLMPQRGIADGPAYRFYAYASDPNFDSLYYRWYFDGTDSVTSGLFPNGVSGYATWTPTGDTHTYTVRVRVFDQTGLTNDTMPTTTFKTVAEGEIIWGIAAEFVASPAIDTTLWKGNTWPAIICGSTDEDQGLCVVDAYQSFFVNQVSVPDADAYNSSAAIGTDGTRYVGNENGGFYAFSRDDSRGDTFKWRFGTSDSGMTATAALGNDGGIYCGGEDQHIHKLIDNGASATEVWSYPLRRDMTSSPAIGADGNIVCCDDSGYVYSLTPGGTLNWEVSTGGPRGISSSPAIASDGTVYVGTEAGHLFALNDDSIVWSYATDSSFAISSSPIIGPDGNVYFGCDDGKLYRIDQNSHLPVADWPITVSRGAINSTPLLCADNIIYIADDDSLYAYDVNDGSHKWAVALTVPPTKGSGHRPPRLSLDNQPSAVVDRYGIIYISTWSGEGGIFAIAGRSSGTLAATDWPMFHHDAKHTGRSGAR